jgi:hypothetical protein
MHQLEIMRHFHKNKLFLGVYPSDKLPKIKTRPCAFILNLDASGKPGSHWCAVYFDENGGAEYYDPFGFEPMCRSYLFANAPDGVIYNPHQIQWEYSVSCGEFTVNLLQRRLAGESFCEILSSYSTNLALNDWMV